MTQLFKLNHAQLAHHIPEGTPRTWDIRLGLPEPKRMLQVMAGSSPAAYDARVFVLGHMQAALHRVEELEHAEPVPQAPSQEAEKLRRELNELQEENAALRAKVETLQATPAPAQAPTPAPSDLLDVMLLRRQLATAETRARAYYSSWRALERRVAEKARPIPSGEMNLALAAVNLLDKGYIQGSPATSQFSVEDLCALIADATSAIPCAGDPSYATTPVASRDIVTSYSLEPLMSVGDAFPVEFILRDSGVTHSYRRVDGAQALIPAAEVTGYQELEQINTALQAQLQEARKSAAYEDEFGNTYKVTKARMDAAGRYDVEVLVSREGTGELTVALVGRRELLEEHCRAEENAAMARERQEEIFFRTDKGTTYGCDNMSIGPDGSVSSMAIKIRRPGGSEERVGFVPVTKVDELEASAADSREQIVVWRNASELHALNEAFYYDVLTKTALALNDPEVFKADDGSVMNDPLVSKIPELVAKLVQNQGSEAGALLARNIVLLDKFRSGVRAITDPMEGQDEKLLEMLTMLKGRVLFTGNGTHFLAQSMEMRNRALYRITGLYYNGHDCEPVDFVDTRVVGTQPEEEPKALPAPTVLRMAFQDLLERIEAPDPQKPLEDCHTVSAGPLHLTLALNDGNLLERRWDGFDFTVLTLPRGVTKQEQANHLMGTEYKVETNTLYLLAAWNGEHPTNWKPEATFNLSPQIIHRER